MTEAEQRARPAPEAVKAVPVRHPGRWVAVVVILVLVAMFVNMLVTNKHFDWPFMFANMFSPPVLHGALTTIGLTVSSMVIGVALGVILAVMRLSANPVLSGVAWLFTWFFRAMPRIVLMVVFGNLGILYARLEAGFPFDTQIGHLLGIDFHARLFGVDAPTLLTGFMAALIGLALSEAAYMAEIVRAGIQSIDEGQSEAAGALGMSRGQTMRRIVLPQAMRVIIPPTGNETISMLKDTALAAYVPVNSELFFQIQAVGNRTFNVFPMLVSACLWYLALSSVLMLGQYFLERRYSRGRGRTTGGGPVEATGLVNGPALPQGQ